MSASRGMITSDEEVKVVREHMQEIKGDKMEYETLMKGKYSIFFSIYSLRISALFFWLCSYFPLFLF